MDWLLQTVIILGMFVLRLGVPLAITLAVGYWLRRLDAKWQAEAQAQREAELSQQQAPLDAEIKRPEVTKEPCWVIKACPEAVYQQCPAYSQPHLPCWLARFRAGGMLPARCYRCTLFSQRQTKKYRP